ncbi:MAG: formate dehydrogenase accessory sulfurtransferase FdhD [Rhizobiales bacterium]|nr:formate dehydrogenase accessory sulfurtransferase FdhD [Hyphomicrobiales bacterium]
MAEPLVPVRSIAWRNGRADAAVRSVAEETAIAFTYGGSTQAVMMATPADLDDFAVGFTLNEGIADHRSEVLGVETIEAALGIELRIALAADRAGRLAARRRALAGPVGCGLCGIESLEEAAGSVPAVADDTVFDAPAIAAAMASLAALQVLNRQSHAVHAAAFWRPGGEDILLREDVGRHNALDKLAGALARADMPGQGGAVLLTSRVSVEMVQKTARIGAPLLVAVSAPTALAIRTAEAAGITLAAIARADGFELFTRPDRIRFAAEGEAGRHVA